MSREERVVLIAMFYRRFLFAEEIRQKGTLSEDETETRKKRRIFFNGISAPAAARFRERSLQTPMPLASIAERFSSACDLRGPIIASEEALKESDEERRARARAESLPT